MTAASAHERRRARRTRRATALLTAVALALLGWGIWATWFQPVAERGQVRLVNARAVVVPTTGGARTIAVPGCGSGSGTARAAVTLPAGTGTRVVVVPGCATPGHGALRVVQPGAVIPTDVGRRLAGVVVVPSTSTARTIVVPRCRGAGRATAARRLTLSGAGSRLEAPACRGGAAA